jgi:hypothetical protein
VTVGSRSDRPDEHAARGRRGPLAPDDVPVTQDETVVGGTPTKPGRTYRIRGYPRP